MLSAAAGGSRENQPLPARPRLSCGLARPPPRSRFIRPGPAPSPQPGALWWAGAAHVGGEEVRPGQPWAGSGGLLRAGEGS